MLYYYEIVVKGRIVPILIFANKMDISGALSAAECSDALELQRIKDKPWQIWYFMQKILHI
jgi:signal recognition particle receptor subunit beta